MVGSLNAIVGYSAFSGTFFLIGVPFGYWSALLIAHFVTSIWSYFSMKRIVFHRKTNFAWAEFTKFQAGFVIPLLVNSLAVPLLSTLPGISVYLGQAIMTVVLALVSFTSNKHFAFRETK